MMFNNRKYIRFIAYLCILVCIGEFIVMFILGSYYPGYNQLKNTMSSLGASISPVSDIISSWWIWVGFMFIFFAAGLKNAFTEHKKSACIAAWVIAIYGIGEGIGSGLFKANHIAGEPTLSCMIHDTMGGIGVAAILIFPLAMMRVIPKAENRFFNIFSWIVFVLGLSSITLFLFRFSPDGKDILTVYQGLWQRLFMLIEYVYVIIIAVMMIRKSNSKVKKKDLEVLL